MACRILSFIIIWAIDDKSNECDNRVVEERTIAFKALQIVQYGLKGTLVVIFFLAICFRRLVKFAYYFEIMIQIITSLTSPPQNFIRSYLLESSLIFAGSFYHFIPALVLSIMPFASYSLGNLMAYDRIGGFASGAIVFY